MGFVRISCLTLLLITSASSNADESFGKMAKKMAKASSAPLITSSELQKEMEDMVILDSRELNEFEVSHLPGAVHVGYKKFDLSKTLKALPKNKKVVVYCSVGYRSGKVADKLRSQNIKAFNLEGGIFGWANENRKLVQSKKEPTQKVHGYSWSWSKWLNKGKSIFK